MGFSASFFFRDTALPLSPFCLPWPLALLQSMAAVTSGLLPVYHRRNVGGYPHNESTVTLPWSESSEVFTSSWSECRYKTWLVPTDPPQSNRVMTDTHCRCDRCFQLTL